MLETFDIVGQEAMQAGPSGCLNQVKIHSNHDCTILAGSDSKTRGPDSDVTEYAVIT
jgi:hypothetical protein